MTSFAGESVIGECRSHLDVERFQRVGKFVEKPVCAIDIRGVDASEPDQRLRLDSVADEIQRRLHRGHREFEGVVAASARDRSRNDVGVGAHLFLYREVSPNEICQSIVGQVGQWS
ncbi:MAG TPA: hypothetical protein VFF07_01855 [Actinomycetota bacterium]|nr:hypothetical protein [Actinomycetota bacterium]